MSQCEMVLNHLRTNGSITPLEAEKEYGIMRLGARIYDLKQQGHMIGVRKETENNRFGKPTTYARYFLN